MPRLARDGDYASAVLGAWWDEVAARDERYGGGDGPGGSSSVSAPLVYGRAADGASLHGRVYRRRPPPPETNDADPPPPPSPHPPLLPGIILFHTGAGPQDVFLRWKADSLVSDRETFGDGGGGWGGVRRPDSRPPRRRDRVGLARQGAL